MTAQEYRDRRNKGQCVQCCKQAEVRHGRAMALCASCGQKRREYDKVYGAPELDNEAIAYPAEPKRAPYKSDSLPPMPPVPVRCPKCSGCLLTEQDEGGGPYIPRCLNCGKRILPTPIPLEEIDLMKSGPVLPVVMR